MDAEGDRKFCIDHFAMDQNVSLSNSDTFLSRIHWRDMFINMRQGIIMNFLGHG